MKDRFDILYGVLYINKDRFDTLNGSLYLIGSRFDTLIGQFGGLVVEHLPQMQEIGVGFPSGQD